MKPSRAITAIGLLLALSWGTYKYRISPKTKSSGGGGGAPVSGYSRGTTYRPATGAGYPARQDVPTKITPGMTMPYQETQTGAAIGM